MRSPVSVVILAVLLMHCGDPAEVVEPGTPEPEPLSSEDPQQPETPDQLEDTPDLEEMEVLAEDIAVAHTPGCGWEKFPRPVLATCTEALVDGAPDLRGIWQTFEGAFVGRVERIEQCGDRVVITSGKVTHDMRADGTLENGVNDVSGFNCQAIRVRAQFVDGALVLSPEGSDVQVVRFLDGDVLVVEHPLIGGRMEALDALPPEIDAE